VAGDLATTIFCEPGEWHLSGRHFDRAYDAVGQWRTVAGLAELLTAAAKRAIPDFTCRSTPWSCRLELTSRALQNEGYGR
jgi:hypothetical protein